MVFTSTTFVFLFFPLFLMSYYGVIWISKKYHFLLKFRISDIMSILLSLFFYSWAGIAGALWLVFFVSFVYIFVFLSECTKNLFIKLPLYREESKGLKQISPLSIRVLICFMGIAWVLSLLIRYKYADFINYNFQNIGIHINPGKLVMMPIGLSFLVFSAISYFLDVKNGKAELGSPIDCAMYLLFFPKIISGPIILWRDFKCQISSRSYTQKNFISGINLICIGFAKKVLLADLIGLSVVDISKKAYYGVDKTTVLLSAFLYTLQIYYDFSGYSDVAIGLGNLMGFKCNKNFDYPYLSCSITEFWRKWHISLGTWFREYVYIPLGGNKKGCVRTLLNLGVVFLLTGIWHGASWNYVCWGIINGLLVIIERIIRDKPIYKKMPAFLKWMCTMFIVMVCWDLFRSGGMVAFLHRVSSLILTDSSEAIFTWEYFLDRRLIFLITVGCLGATITGYNKIRNFFYKITDTVLGLCIKEVILLLLWILSIVVIISSNFSPFIYFQY